MRPAFNKIGAMESTQDIKESSRAAVVDAWATLQAHARNGEPLSPDAYRLAFADPEFLLRPETRGIRFQLELLKPDLGLAAAGVNNTVVVYGSARVIAPDVAEAQLAAARATGDTVALGLAENAVRGARYYAAARAFARIVAEHSLHQQPADRLFICTGGGPGVMEAANRGAHDVGVPSVGLNIGLPHEQQTNAYVTPYLAFKFHYFALRKMHFMMRAKALVAFPGGFGTLDELFEVLTLVQTGKAKPVPIVLFGTAFWKKLINFEAMVEEGTISPQDLGLFLYTDDPQEAWDFIKGFYGL